MQFPTKSDFIRDRIEYWKGRADLEAEIVEAEIKALEAALEAVTPQRTIYIFGSCAQTDKP